MPTSKLLHRILRTSWRTSLVSSSAAHLLCAAGVVAVELWAFSHCTLPPASQVLELEGRFLEEPSRVALAQVSPTPEDMPRLAASATAATEETGAHDDPRWRQALLEGNSPADAAPQGQASALVQRELLDSITAAEGRSDEENLDRLKTLSDQLTATSSAESIDQLASSLQRWLGTEERATRPADEPVEGEFDLQTAQLHDIVRDDSTGQVRYTAVLLDAAGRTMESPLTEAEGESVYRVMQLMKQNPLLERVYRGVVLSLLDKLLKQQNP